MNIKDPNNSIPNIDSRETAICVLLERKAINEVIFLPPKEKRKEGVKISFNVRSTISRRYIKNCQVNPIHGYSRGPSYQAEPEVTTETAFRKDLKRGILPVKTSYIHT